MSLSVIALAPRIAQRQHVDVPREAYVKPVAAGLKGAGLVGVGAETA